MNDGGKSSMSMIRVVSNKTKMRYLLVVIFTAVLFFSVKAQAFTHGQGAGRCGSEVNLHKITGGGDYYYITDDLIFRENQGIWHSKGLTFYFYLPPSKGKTWTFDVHTSCMLNSGYDFTVYSENMYRKKVLGDGSVSAPSVINKDGVSTYSGKGTGGTYGSASCNYGFTKAPAGYYYLTILPRRKSEGYYKECVDTMIVIRAKPIAASGVTVTFNSCGGTKSKSRTVTSCTSYGSLPTPTRKGYTFAGWYTAKSGGSRVYASSICNSGKKVTLYAHWTKCRYSIKWVLNGGTFGKNKPVYSYYVDSTVKVKTPTKKGYKFAGWYSRSNCIGSKVKKIKKGSTGNRTLYAKWTPIKYTIVYKGNGANSGKMKNTANVQYGKGVTLRNNAFKKKGYTFAGWAYSPKGKVVFRNGQKVWNLATVNKKKVILYAIWRKNGSAGTNNHTAASGGNNGGTSNSGNVNYVAPEPQWSGWSEWSTTAVSGDSNREVETKKQYRYADKQTTTSTNSQMSGWTQNGSSVSYGAYGGWSNWQDSAVYASDTREVQTSTVWGYYYYRCPHCGNHCYLWNSCPTWAGGCGNTPYSSYPGMVMCWSTKNPNETSSFHGVGRNYYDDAAYGRVFYFFGQDWSSARTGYRYRDRAKTVTYYYWRWKNWSGWSDTAYTSSSSRKVQSRTLYRYRTRG